MASLRTREEAGTRRFVTTEVDTSASEHPGITASVASKEGPLTPGATKKRIPTPTTTKLPSIADQNADSLHQSLVKIAGNSISLSSSSPIETRFRWAYCPLGSRDLKIVYNGARFTTIFRLSARVSVPACDDKNCNFDVDNIQLADAGFFTCMGQPVSKSWSVTILGKYSWNYFAIYFRLFGHEKTTVFEFLLQ